MTTNDERAKLIQLATNVINSNAFEVIDPVTCHIIAQDINREASLNARSTLRVDKVEFTDFKWTVHLSNGGKQIIGDH